MTHHDVPESFFFTTRNKEATNPPIWPTETSKCLKVYPVSNLLKHLSSNRWLDQRLTSTFTNKPFLFQRSDIHKGWRSTPGHLQLLPLHPFPLFLTSTSFSFISVFPLFSSPSTSHSWHTNMASAQSEQSSVLQEELTCPVCLDLYRDPYLLPCGHNFCKTCLDRLKRQAERGRLRCPECRDSHRCGTSFQKNFKLANISDDYRQRRRATNAAATALKSRDLLSLSLTSQPARSMFAVPCDYCPSVAAEASGVGAAAEGSSSASVSQEDGDGLDVASAAAASSSTFAVKTCLKCEVSMCQEHVKPHLELPAFREHPLTEPMNDLWKRKCPDHDEIYRYSNINAVKSFDLESFSHSPFWVQVTLTLRWTADDDFFLSLLQNTFKICSLRGCSTYFHYQFIMLLFSQTFICFPDITAWMTRCVFATPAP